MRWFFSLVVMLFVVTVCSAQCPNAGARVSVFRSGLGDRVFVQREVADDVTVVEERGFLGFGRKRVVIKRPRPATVIRIGR